MMVHFWNSIGSAALLATCLPLVCGEPKVGASIRTTSGLIKGHAAPRKSEVSEYLGIPYASPPTGDLRFAAPVAYKSEDTVQASAYSPDCPAKTGTTPDYPGFTKQGAHIVESFAQQLGTSQSEDCLYLNVWTKHTSSKPKPVLVWIHGGRFTIGGANSPYYDGQNLANDHDVIVVTFNYRLNIFGFSGAPGFPQNVGLLDQRLAVEWVHRNIAAFGGDPDRITIFGQSAGGSAVDYYSFAWADKPLVSGLISHSGTALSFVPNTAEESASYFYHVSKSLDCGDSDDEVKDVVACLRQKPWKDVVEATAKVPFASTPALPQPVFHPTVDGVTVFDDYAERSAAGKFASVPFLVNSNDYEPGYYRVSAYGANVSLSDSAWAKFNLAAFTCPSGASAKDRAAHGVPVWHSRYFGDWDNLRLYSTSGSYHGCDLPMVFGTAEQITELPNSDDENKFAEYISSAWVAFASDPKKGLTEFGWPQYKHDEETLIGLAYQGGTGAKFFKPAKFQEGCAALKGDSTPGKGAF